MTLKQRLTQHCDVGPTADISLCPPMMHNVKMNFLGVWTRCGPHDALIVLPQRDAWNQHAERNQAKPVKQPSLLSPGVMPC